MVRRLFYIVSLSLVASLSIAGYFWPWVWWGLALIAPVVLLGVYDSLQQRHSILRNFPVLGHARYLFEKIRPEIRQYFLESDTENAPLPREERAMVYQRAKKAIDTQAFGTQRDVYEPGYEWLAHSLAPQNPPNEEPRFEVGGPECTQPYLSSRLNISAMSFGSLSSNAVLALNKGAAKGGFSHNTGEGGISSYHLEGGGDLVWQLGTGYFGACSEAGVFDAEAFAEKAKMDSVKMIELKLSQGAKPGRGGLLPAEKVTEEIAEIRGIPSGEDCISPPGHSEFDTPIELMHFIARLRDLSGGKPVGIKFCLGHPREFFAMAKAMLETGITPDFITVDGKEGGTGAAPLEFSNSVGTPMREAVSLVHGTLRGVGLRDKISIFASGKILSGFDMFRAMALGADGCNSARAMMLAIGCIQARECNTNKCPAGVATQDPSLNKGLVVEDKFERVYNYHHGTIDSFMELLGAAGLKHPEKITPEQVLRRIDEQTIRSYAHVYPQFPQKSLLNDQVPETFRGAWEQSTPESFQATQPRPKPMLSKPRRASLKAQ